MTDPKKIRRLANIETLIVEIEGAFEAIADRLTDLDCATHDPIAVRIEEAKLAGERAVIAVRRQLAQLDAIEVK